MLVHAAVLSSIAGQNMEIDVVSREITVLYGMPLTCQKTPN